MARDGDLSPQGSDREREASVLREVGGPGSARVHDRVGGNAAAGGFYRDDSSVRAADQTRDCRFPFYPNTPPERSREVAVEHSEAER